MAPNYPHLLWNHLPLFSLTFGFVILLISLLRNNATLRKTGLIIIVLGGLFSIPAYFTGEEAEHFVEELSGISEHYLEEHEELGETAYYVNLIAGITALIALLTGVMLAKYRKLIDTTVLLISFAGLGITVIAAKHGGQIRRAELWDQHEVQQHAPEEHHHKVHED